MIVSRGLSLVLFVVVVAVAAGADVEPVNDTESRAGFGASGDSVKLVRERNKCVRSPTTASGSLIQRGRKFCSGELIFEDNFDFLDFEIWEHENTLAGGGVSNIVSLFCIRLSGLVSDGLHFQIVERKQ